MLSDRDEAEDAAQEALIRAFRAWQSRDPESPEAWIRVVARREAYRIRARRRDPLDDLSSANEPHCEDDVAERVVARLTVQSALGYVGERDRGLLLRRYVLGQSSTQIANELALPAATVRVRVHRATKQIRRYLEET